MGRRLRRDGRSHKSPVLPSLPQYRGAEDMGEAQAPYDPQWYLEPAFEAT